MYYVELLQCTELPYTAKCIAVHYYIAMQYI